MDLCLVVVWIALRQAFHRLRIGYDAGAVIYLVVIGIHHRQRVDITFLALGLEADRSRFLDCCRALREILHRRRRMGVPQ